MKIRLAILALCVSLNVAAAEPLPDAALKNLNLPDVKIESIKHVEGKASHYDVDGIIGGTIRFELLLPDAWNKRFTMGGGGGFVGSVQNSSRNSVNQGYATVGTDTGHQGGDGSFALNDALAQLNFGHVAVHRTAEVAKAIIRAHYGSHPEYSYFLGCSRGGGQAMMEAQRYPGDFDGIVAGAPAFDWSGIGAMGVNIVQAFYPDPNKLDKTIFSNEEITKLHNEAIARFDEQDGLKDGILSNPDKIDFNLDDVDWLNDAQRTAIRTIYEGPSTHPMPGYPVGSEMEWFNWLIGPIPGQPVPALSFHFAVGLFQYFVFNDPDWDYSTYDLANVQKDWALADSTLSATDTNIDDFKALGGKLIIWHGWSDAALSANRSINYFDALLERDPAAQDYARLYLIAGCGHCGGGPGISSVDWLSQITAWVEKDDAPESIVASKGKGTRAKTRPLAPYPATIAYNGSGDPDKAESFATISK